MENASPTPEPPLEQRETTGHPDQHCPVCSATLLHEKCKVVCRSPTCVYRIIFNCAEF